MKNLLSVVGSILLLVLASILPTKSRFISAPSKSIETSQIGAAFNCGGNGDGGI